MKSSTGHHEVQSNAMKAYRKQRQYIYRHCQLCHVTTSYAVMVVVCILMLPMLELAIEHVQLTTTCNINHVPPPCMNFSHTPLELPSLNNTLPAMVLQNHASSLVEYHVSNIHIILLQWSSCFPQLSFHWSGEEGSGCGGVSTATDEWRHRDEPRTSW